MSIKNLNLDEIPQTAGVYFFKDKKGIILYIGKAKNIKVRLGSYFRKSSPHTPAKKKMLLASRTISWQKTDNDIEALILEASLIKKLKPKYNIVMRDDKNYFFVVFSADKYPKISITHQPMTDLAGPSIVGPFTDGVSLKLVLKSLRKTFPYCTCKTSHKRPCISSQTKKCPGICCLTTLDMDRQQLKKYKQNINAVKNILSGKKQKILNELEKEMAQLSKKQQYEDAGDIYKKITALKKIFKHKNIISREDSITSEKAVRYLKTLLGIKKPLKRIEAYDISNIHGANPVGSMIVFINGRPLKDEYRRFKIKFVAGINDPAMMAEIIFRRMRNKWTLPDLIVVDGGIAQLNAAKKAIQGKNIPLIGYAKRSKSIIISSKKNIPINILPAPLQNLLDELISEAHRFAISYHRLKRKKALIKESLH